MHPQNHINNFVIILIFGVLLTGCAKSRDHIIKNDITQEYKLENKQFFEWDKLKKNWYQNTYKSCKNKFGIKLNCNDCTAFYLRANLAFDENGKIVKIDAVKEYYCGLKNEKAIRNCLINGLVNSRSNSLKGMTIQSFLGNGLRC